MATVTYWSTGAGKKPGPSQIGSVVGVHQVEIDFSEKNVAAADVVQIANIEAGTRVIAIGWEVTTAEGDTCTATLGDGDGAASWDASINLNSAAGGGSAAGTDAYALTSGIGKLYTSADTIDLVMGHDTDTAVVTFQIMYITCENT
jgi:hypothetical protein